MCELSKTTEHKGKIQKYMSTKQLEAEIFKNTISNRIKVQISWGRDQDRLGGHGTHFPHEHEDTSKCGESITENELETGRKTFVQPRL